MTTMLGAVGDALSDSLGGALPSLSLDAEALKSLLSLSANARLLTLDLPASVALPGGGFVVERMQGREGLGCLDAFVVDVVSPSAHVELKTLIGLEAGVGIHTADGATRSWYGLVTRIAALGADGSLARYRLWLSPWPVLLGLREDSYVFQDQTTLDTVEALFADYRVGSGQTRYELRVTDSTRDALPKHPIRTQYRESDLDFLLRILAADGLSFWIEHDATHASSSGGGGALRHTLVITDEVHDWADADPATIRYHRRSPTETTDAVHAFAARRTIRTNATARSGWNAGSVLAPGAEDEVTPASEAIPRLEDHDGDTDPGRADLSPDAAVRLARLRLLAHQADAAVFHGESSVRSLAPGTVFTLSSHPDFGSDLLGALSGNGANSGFGADYADARFKLVAIQHHATNNLRTGLEDLKGRADARGDGLGERGTYTNTFDCVPAEIALAPPPRLRPVAPGLVTALVVGVAGEAATTTRDHVVKLQFHFQRGSAPNPGGLTDTGWAGDDGNAPGSEASGTWVRVSQALAGPDWGAVFVPRIGTEVLVAFEQADLDRPLIVGSLHNGEDLPPFQAGQDSGVDHPGVIAGFHTKSLEAGGGDGYNQLVFDDTSGETGAQLASSTQASQLNLGRLVQRSPGSAVRGGGRGEGAELTTDGWAVLRAGKGLLVTATSRSQAVGDALDAPEALGQMKGSAALAKALSDAAKAQGSAQLTSPDVLESLVSRLGATVPRSPAPKGAKTDPALSLPAFSAPALLQETPGSAALTSPAAIAHFSGDGLHIVSQGQTHLTAGKTLEAASGLDTALYTHEGGITAIAANGPVSIQAHTDELKLLADQSVTVTSTAGKIEILAADKIVLQAGQSSITLDGENITFTMPGLFSVKGSQQVLAGAGKGEAALPTLPNCPMSINPPETPLQKAYSETLDYSAVPTAWLPFSLGKRTIVVTDHQAIKELARSNESPYTQALVTAEPINVSYWHSTGATWTIEESIEAADELSELDDEDVDL